jgi:hypothetical protein
MPLLAAQGRYKNFCEQDNRFLATPRIIHTGGLKMDVLTLALCRYGT